MSNREGLVGSDGRPVRQFGDEIIEPGEAFSWETLDTIRELISDEDEADAGEPDCLPDPGRLPTLPDTSAEEETGNPSAAALADVTPHRDGAAAFDTDDRPDSMVWDSAAPVPERLSERDPAEIEAQVREAARVLSGRNSWRYVIVTERAPGRFVRRVFSRPRYIALVILTLLGLLTPWTI